MAAKRSIIIDTDPGIDDALAIFLACASPEFDIRAITTVAGNVGINRTTRNALQLTELAGRVSIPVHRGADRPLRGSWTTIEDIHGQNGLGDIDLPAPSRTEFSTAAVDALIALLSDAAADSMTLVLIGPQTNLALALQRKPAIANAIREIAVMGGTLEPEGGNATRFAEFNIHVDPVAADIVLKAGRPMIWAPLEVARQASVDALWIDLLRAVSRPCTVAAAGMLDFYLRSFARPTAALYDPLTILALLMPELFELRSAALEIDVSEGETAGQTRFRLSDGDGQVRVAATCHADRVRTVLLERLAAL
ncbi:nucleoside hydrolase [Dongia deserti]|uniref:nucleoside hydrolase n=1 Tax=Dongia deserti TaxID=2268030 RepID=UPI0013C50BF6|nr:nucleoside hydrolase [Dongia deserti]